MDINFVVILEKSKHKRITKPKHFIMKQRIFTLLAAFFLLASSNINASHLSGAEFHFEHVSGNDYIVSLHIYRDCSGIGVPTNITINMASVACAINTSHNLPKTSGPIVVTTIPNAQTTCMGGPVQGYEEYIYSDTITLSQCSDWIFSWTSCCRNSAITNLVNPGGASMYIESMFDNTVANNSPTYFIDPIFYGSMGSNFSVALGGFDPDGDQLLFSLAAPADGASTSVPFASGLSAAQPLNILGGTSVSFSATTGQFDCVLSTGTQIVVFDIIVEEWRNGVKIAEHRRSLQILPINLGSGQMLAPPVVNNPSNGTIIDAYTMEYNSAAQPFSFSMLFNDPDANDVITYNAVYSSLETIFPNAQVTAINPNGNLNELELSIDIPNPSPTLFSIVIEENNYLQQSFSYELRDANATNVNNIETKPAAVRIYPNPVAKTTTFEVDSEAYKTLELTVYGMTGQVVSTQTTSGTNLLEFNRGDLPAGMYSFQLKGDGMMVNTGLLQLK